MITNLVICLILIALMLMLVNALKNKEVVIKVISLNSITSYVMVLICLLVVLDQNNVYFLDVAIIYGLVSFIASIALLKYSERIR